MKIIPEHRKNRAISRGYNPEDMETKRFLCERPKGCGKNCSSVHHIRSSCRATKDDRPKNLIGLCYRHHEWIHDHNRFDNRKLLLEFVKKCIVVNIPEPPPNTP